MKKKIKIKKNTDGIVQSNRSETTQGEVNDEKKHWYLGEISI